MSQNVLIVAKLNKIKQLYRMDIEEIFGSPSPIPHLIEHSEKSIAYTLSLKYLLWATVNRVIFERFRQLNIENKIMI